MNASAQVIFNNVVANIKIEDGLNELNDTHMQQEHQAFIFV
jgi:hypothetical protein